MRALAPICGLVLLATLAGAPRAAHAVDLLGTWHVLIHYKDSGTSHPERERWQDRIWVFEMEGSRLRWTEYPIVVFEDQSGRFERLGGSRASRVLAFWEPNPAQLSQIRTGLEINPRGSRSKTLRASETGWSSTQRAGGYQSARIITFTETWIIEDPAGLPKFRFDDVMGSAASEAFEGSTSYETLEVSPNGDELRGRYDRDGTRIGTFRLTRSGKTSVVKGSGKSAGERVYEAFFGEAGTQLFYADKQAPDEAALRSAIDAGRFGEDERRALRVGLEQQVAAEYERQGNDPREFRPQIQSLARKMTSAFVDDGRSFEEIMEMVRDGRLRP